MSERLSTPVSHKNGNRALAAKIKKQEGQFIFVVCGAKIILAAPVIRRIIRPKSQMFLLITIHLYWACNPRPICWARIPKGYSCNTALSVGICHL